MTQTEGDQLFEESSPKARRGTPNGPPPPSSSSTADPTPVFRFPLHQAVTTAGRDPRSDIFLDDMTVSRHHAEFRLERGVFQVVDIDSLNGTYVNGHPIDSAVLTNGDEIQMGKFRLALLTRPANG